MRILLHLLVVLVLLLAPVWPGDGAGVCAADLWQWRQSGYGGGGRFTAAAVDARQPALVYVGSDVAGFFRSTDAAETFTPLGRGLTGLAVADILPVADAGLLLILTDDGLYGSRDQGDTLRRIIADVRYADREPGSHLLLDAGDGSFFAAGDTGGVFRISPSGEDWSVTSLGLAGLKCNGLAFSGTTLYVATDAGVRRLVQGAFEAVDTGLPAGHTQVTDIAADAGGVYCLEKDTGPYALVAGRWTARSPDSALWAGSDPPTYKNLAVCPDRAGHLFVATHPESWPHLLFESGDAGDTWQRITQFRLTGGPANWATGLEATERLAFSADGRFGILTDWWNVWRSPDGGQSWLQAYKGLQNTVVNAIAVHPENADSLFLATSDNGLMATTDGGTNWQRRMAGVVDGDATAVVLADGQPDTVYLLMVPWTSEDTADTAYFHLYRSDDGGATWRLYRFSDRRRTFSVAYADGRPTALIVAPDDPDRVYVAVNGYGIYVVDTATLPAGGDVTAVNLAADWTTPYFRGPHSLLALAGSPGVFYVATLAGGVWRSDDHGAHWRQLPGSAGFVFALAADPADPAHLLAAAAEKTLLESRDGGEHWESRALPGARPDYQPASDVVFGPAGSGLVFVGTGAYDNKTADGLFVSTDGGERFSQADNALPQTAINVLAVQPQRLGAVLVGFNGLGLYTAVRDADSECPACCPAAIFLETLLAPGP